MKVLILDGISQGTGAEVGEAIAEAARKAGASVKRVALADVVLAPCQGEFDCWVKTPGLCRTQDAIQLIAQDMHDADLAVWVSDVTFGGYSAQMKRAVDRLICLVEPFFEKAAEDGLTHHARRYAHYPAMLYVGWQRTLSADARSIFTELAAGNALNLGAPWYRTVVLSSADPGWRLTVQSAVELALTDGPSDRQDALELPHAALERACAPDRPQRAAAPRSVTLLVGSPRPKGTSTSESLGRFLLDELSSKGLTTTVVHAMSFVKDGKAADAAVEAMLGSELLVVASPLYVDSLPSVTTRALERVASQLAARWDTAALRSVVGIVNCGFPEAVHVRTAMRILQAFARESGLAWAGGLAMGAGEAVHGRALGEVRGMVHHQLQALTLSAAALASGQTVPAEARARMQKSVLPPMIYRWMGAFGWAMQAKQHGVPKSALHARPLDGAEADKARA